jgi:glycosyltransferase involved in cell wall biosynthesis
MRAVALPSFLRTLSGYTNEEMIPLIRGYNVSIQKGRQPDVTIVMPAYNEEENILPALLSVSQNKTKYAVEIIVVNNNSKDRTEELVRATGITCLNEPVPGVTNARNKGLAAARGKYMLNADSDSIYPPDWIELIISPLENNDVALSYGRFSFIPGGSTGRFTYFLYENLADILRWSKKKFKEEAMNVYGCNSGFRRAQCLEVNGYEHPPGTNEDGWLAVKLRNKGFGKLHYVPSNKAMVWTVDRHLQKDGGLWKALLMRVKQALVK